MDIFDVLEKLGKAKNIDFTRARLKGSYTEFVERWRSYYSGNVPGINTDTSFNGESFTQFTRQSMRLAKQIAKKWACLLFTEAFQVTLGNEAETEKFRQLEKQIDFRSKINQAAIEGYGMGTSALLASADIILEGDKVTGGKVRLDTIKYDNIYPLEFDKNDIKTIAFVKQEQKSDSTVYTISVHTIENGQAVIENFVATVKGDSVDFSGAEKVVTKLGFDNQMYCIIKPNVANDYTDTLPFGASIFADALAPIEDVDLAADLLRNDVKEGNQKTFIGRDLVFEKLGKAGDKKKLFDNNRSFFIIPQNLAERGDGGIKQLFETIIPEIRTEQLWKVVRDSLNWACLASGLGKGTLDIIPASTATEVIHTEAEKMQNKSLHEQYLEGELIKLVKALCELSGKVGNPIDASEVTIVWQDSVIVDTGEEKKLSLVEIDAGVISKAEYRMKYYGETKEEAEAQLAEIGENNESVYSRVKEMLERNNAEGVLDAESGGAD